MSSTKTRMTGVERRNQLVELGRHLFAEKGFEAASIEELAARANVSKPVIYEHFGGKEGLYAVIVDREVQTLTSTITEALRSAEHPLQIVENTALSFLGYIEHNSDGFLILSRDAPSTEGKTTYSSLLSDVANQVEHLLAAHFARRGLEEKMAPHYAQMLVGMISLAGQWWLETRDISRDEFARHLVNLTWNGLRNLQRDPQLRFAKTE